MELLGYTAAVVILGVFLAFHYNEFFETDERRRGMSFDLTTVAIFLIVHAVVTALTNPVFAFVGAAVVFAVMLHPVGWAKRRIEAAGFDTTRRTMNAPLPEDAPAVAVPDEEPVDVASIEPVEVREPVTAGGGGLTPDENAAWEDLTRRIDD